MRMLCRTFLILGLISITSAAWPAASKPARKGAGNGKLQAPAACTTKLTMGLDVLQGNDAKMLAQTLGSVFAEEGLVVRSANDALCVAMRGNAEAAVPKNLHDDLAGIVNLMDTDAFAGLKFNSDYVIHLRHLTAKQVATAFPHPAPGINLRAVGGTYLVLVPSAEVVGNDSTTMNQALDLQAAGIKHDLTSLDNQSVLDAEDAEAARNLEKEWREDATKLKSKQASHDAKKLASPRHTEDWFTEHTIRLAVLDPREVTARMGGLFSSKQLKLHPLVEEHAVTILPSVPPDRGLLTDAETLERDALYHQEQHEQDWLKKAGVTVPAATSHVPWLLDRVVRLYYLRDAKDIATQFNLASKDHPIVEALSDDNQDDLLLVLPPATGKPDHFNAIHRAIARLDLPRPQVSLQVWSYQISGKEIKPKHKKKAARGPHGQAGRTGGKKQNADAKTKATKKSQTKDVRKAFIYFNQQVGKVNGQLTDALQQGFNTIVEQEQQAPKNFFDPTFKDYLTGHYEKCVYEDRYCLGYHAALDIPPIDQRKKSRGTGKGDVLSNLPSAGASLSRLILYLAATNTRQAPCVAHNVISAMQGTDADKKDCQAPKPGYDCKFARVSGSKLRFPLFCAQLSQVTQPRNLYLLRAALLNFLFNYKWIYMYSNDFVPYDLQSSARVLDSLLSPITDAFNQDVDSYIQSQLVGAAEKESGKVNFVSQGKVQVTALSGTRATVNGTVDNYFDVTPTLSLGDVVGGSAANKPGGGLASALAGVLKPKEIRAVQALANVASKQSVAAEVSSGVKLTITPTTLDTASSATLDVDFDVKNNTAPDTANQSGAQKDLLDRVAEHHVTDQVRVDSLKLFDISSFLMDLTHPRPPWTIPIVGQTWKGIFGTVPVFGGLFEFPRAPITKENRSVAIICALVDPTAMDLGLGLHFDVDRIYDPVTGAKDSIHSAAVLGGNVRLFNKKLMRCIADRVVFDGKDLPEGQSCWAEARLSQNPKDFR